MIDAAMTSRTDPETPAAAPAERLILAGTVVLFGAYVLHRLVWLQSLNPDYPACRLDVGVVLLAGAGLLALCLLPSRNGLAAWRAPLSGALLGLVFFVSTLGLALIEPGNIAWLLQGDWAQHFIGWHLYRHAPWQWPPGAFDTFWYPVGTAVVYTDSLPLLAIPLKVLSPLLPTHFQYIGFWLMLNCMLQGVFGVLLMRCFTPRLGHQVLGAGLMLLSPVFISRIGHDTLTTQWLLLAALWLYFRSSDPRRAPVAWATIAIVAALVHPYLNAMVLAILCAFYLRVVFVQHLLDWRVAARYVAVIFACTLLCWWLSGAFTIRPDGGGVPFGKYSANLLTWFDANFMSRWWPTFPLAGSGQYEGRGYLGIGVLVLCALAIVQALRSRSRSSVTRLPLWPLVLVVAAMTLFAFSTRVAFGSHVLMNVTPRRLPLLDIFRSSGRFIWPSVYLITVLSAALVARSFGRFSMALLAAAFLLQAYELAPLHMRSVRLRFATEQTASKQELRDPYWTAAAAGRVHITLVPPPACGKQAAPYLPFSLFAGDHGMSVNTGYLARWDEKGTRRYCQQLKNRLNGGERRQGDLYIVSTEELPHFRATSSVPLDCRLVEGYHACLVAEHPH